MVTNFALRLEVIGKACVCKYLKISSATHPLIAHVVQLESVSNVFAPRKCSVTLSSFWYPNVLPASGVAGGQLDFDVASHELQSHSGSLAAVEILLWPSFCSLK